MVVGGEVVGQASLWPLNIKINFCGIIRKKSTNKAFCRAKIDPPTLGEEASTLKRLSLLILRNCSYAPSTMVQHKGSP